jgi:hypothetical protein
VIFRSFPLPANNSLIIDDDRFLRVVGTEPDPQPRFNALDDLADMTERLAKELAL